MEYTERSTCRLCHSTKLTDILDLGSQYVVDFIAPEDLDAWKRGECESPVPLVLMLCNNCFFVQLRHTVSPDRLYRKFWYKSGINESMRATLKQIVDEAMTMSNAPADCNVLDIACNDGTLLGFYPDSMLKLGFDPAINLQKEAKKNGRTPNIVADYFTKEAYWREMFTTPDAYMKHTIITCIAMFYDLDDPAPFLDLIKQVLAPEGVFVLQMNYLPKMLEDHAIDNICHEHLGYYSLSTLKPLLERHGLQVQDASINDVNGGSIRVFIKHSGVQELERVAKILKAESEWGLDKPETYMAFAHAMQTIKNDLTVFLHRQRNVYDQRIHLYGASTRGSTLMQYLDLPSEWFAGAAERNPEKVGKYTVGTWIPIVSEEEARAAANVFMVLPWHFRSAILEREHSTIMNGARFLFPLPEPSLYSGRRLHEPTTVLESAVR